MKTLKAFKSINTLLTLILITSATKVLASPDTRNSATSANTEVEVSYDDFIQEISTNQKKIIRNSTHSFDDVRIHAGMGYINSFTTLQTKNKQYFRYENAMQISLGVDLFSEHLQAEASYQNFGINQFLYEESLMRNIDLKFAYEDQIEYPWHYRFIGGISHRYLRYKNPNDSVSIEESTPGVLIGAGVLLQVNPILGIGFDLTGRSALLPSSTDQNSFQFAMNVRASL